MLIVAVKIDYLFPFVCFSHAYSYCAKVAIDKDGSHLFECKNYNPSDAIIQQEAMNLKEEV